MAARSEGSRRVLGWKTLVVEVAVVDVRLHWFAAMTASGCASHVPPEDPTRNVIQYLRPARSHDDDEPVRGVLTCGPVAESPQRSHVLVFVTGNL